MVNGRDDLLVSGAMSTTMDKDQPVKLSGRPLILTADNKIRVFQKKNARTVEEDIEREFEKRPDLKEPLLAQFRESLWKQGESSLSSVFITRFLHHDNRKPIIITWMGETDRKIIEKLRIGGIYGSIELTTYNDHGDQEFYLKMIDVISNRVIIQVHLGEFEKGGRMLNLKETHERVCRNQEHSNFLYHDPVICNVLITKCIFNFLLKNLKPINLYRYYERKYRKRKKKNGYLVSKS